MLVSGNVRPLLLIQTSANKPSLWNCQTKFSSVCLWDSETQPWQAILQISSSDNTSEHTTENRLVLMRKRCDESVGALTIAGKLLINSFSIGNAVGVGFSNLSKLSLSDLSWANPIGTSNWNILQPRVWSQKSFLSTRQWHCLSFGDDL